MLIYISNRYIRNLIILLNDLLLRNPPPTNATLEILDRYILQSKSHAQQFEIVDFAKAIDILEHPLYNVTMAAALDETPVSYEDLEDLERDFDAVETEISMAPLLRHKPPHMKIMN